MVFEQVRDMIASQLQVDAASITPESRLVEDLKADSANVMVMILELEQQFEVEVEDEVILNLKTVGDVVNYIQAHK
ncbi:MAG: acyl carrier protein [Candidatus Limiplasma sp.]|nr:acyl carrier protein [Candidatus Limiplasma sp.]MEA5145865.1 acyl carrier protein [Candidatus Limiplasma sp.]